MTGGRFLSLDALDRGRRPIVVLIAGAALALGVRAALLPSEVMNRSFIRWYDFVARNGHFAALRHDFSEYNVPYLYLVATVSLLAPEASAVHVKIIPILFDFALACCVGLCVRLRYPRSRIVPILAALAVLLAPTVILNGAMWGQIDSIHTTFLAASLYCLLARRPAPACVAFGLALAFKPTAGVLAPLLLWLLVKRVVSWRCLLLIPATWLAALLPAWAIGRPLGELLLTDLENVARHQQYALSMNAPNFYLWIPQAWRGLWPEVAGGALTAGVVGAVAVLLRRSRAGVTGERLALLAAFSVIAVPCFLPRMHERYFFPADVVTIVLAFWRPRYWYVPIVVGLTSLFEYVVARHGVWIVALPPGPLFPLPFPLPAAALQATVMPLPLLAILVLLGRRILLTYGGIEPSEAEEGARRRGGRGDRGADGERGGGDRQGPASPQDRQSDRQQHRPQDVEEVDGAQQPEGERVVVERRSERRERDGRRKRSPPVA